MKILKELFEKSSLSRPPQRAENSPCFKRATPRRPLGRSKTSPRGEVFAPSPSRPTFLQFDLYGNAILEIYIIPKRLVVSQIVHSIFAYHIFG